MAVASEGYMLLASAVVYAAPAHRARLHQGLWSVTPPDDTIPARTYSRDPALLSLVLPDRIADLVDYSDTAGIEAGQHFSSWRSQALGFLSDQGTERKLATAPLLVAGDVSVREAISMLEDGRATWGAPEVGQSKFLPEAMEHAGIRHIFFNAFRECVTKQPEYED